MEERQTVVRRQGIRRAQQDVSPLHRRHPETCARRFKDGTGLSTSQKLSIVGTIIGKSKSIKEDDIYEAMLYLHEQGKITVSKLAKALKCTNRTIYRHMGKELKLEKQLLNKENEKI